MQGARHILRAPTESVKARAKHMVTIHGGEHIDQPNLVGRFSERITSFSPSCRLDEALPLEFLKDLGHIGIRHLLVAADFTGLAHLTRLDQMSQRADRIFTLL